MSWIGRDGLGAGPGGAWQRWVRRWSRSGRLALLGAGLPRRREQVEPCEKGFWRESVGEGGGAGRELEGFSEPERTRRKGAKQDAERSKTVRVSLASRRGRWARAAMGACYFVKGWWMIPLQALKPLF